MASCEMDQILISSVRKLTPHWLWGGNLCGATRYLAIMLAVRHASKHVISALLGCFCFMLNRQILGLLHDINVVSASGE